MMVYAYDGSFEDLLCSFYRGLKSEESPEEIVSRDEALRPLASEVKEIRTREGKTQNARPGRFHGMGRGGLYALIKPDYNILGLLALFQFQNEQPKLDSSR